MREITIPDFSGPCEVWGGSINEHGYGVLGINGKTKRAHVVAWEAVNGPVPDGLVLDHLCRNRACINPEHLDPVTNKINTLRGEGPTAQNYRKTHCFKGHELVGDNLLITSQGNRSCNICQREHDQAYKKRMRASQAAARREAKATKGCDSCKHSEWVDGESESDTGWDCNKHHLSDMSEKSERELLDKLMSEKYRNQCKRCFEPILAAAKKGI